MDPPRPNPGYAIPYEIRSIDIINNELAVVSVAAQQDQRGTYLEYFTTAKVNDEWKVIAIVWAWQPGLLLKAE